SYLDGLFVQVPFEPDSVTFSCGVPEIAGATVFVGLPAATTSADGADVAVVEPSPFDAVTRNRSVCPSSAEPSWYCVPFAPPIVEQLPPFLSQRSQAYSYFVGLFDQSPRSPLSTCPRRAAPKIRGAEVFEGFAWAAARLEPTATPASAAASTTPSTARRGRRLGVARARILTSFPSRRTLSCLLSSPRPIKTPAKRILTARQHFDHEPIPCPRPPPSLSG